MSGTSLDGVDAALVDFVDFVDFADFVDLAGSPRLVASHYVPYPDHLRTELLALHVAGPSELHRAALASNRLALLYADAVSALLENAGLKAQAIAAIGCHGQTIRHRPEAGYTLQLNNAALLAERTGIRVVADFRSRDIAAGGQGAPLVPAFHAACFRDATRHRVILNLGGIANITSLPPHSAESAANAAAAVIGFDTGPANMLLDAWAATHLGKPYDADGAFAASGQVIPGLLERCLGDPYFAAPPPKSTGRDHFNLDWLHAMGTAAHRPQDVQATLAELSARSIAQAIARWCPEAQEVHACGGGTHNAQLMKRIAGMLGEIPLAATGALGIPADWVEAMAFAWLAREALCARPGNLPAVTGASGPRVLGAIYPA